MGAGLGVQDISAGFARGRKAAIRIRLMLDLAVWMKMSRDVYYMREQGTDRYSRRAQASMEKEAGSEEGTLDWLPRRRPPSEITHGSVESQTCAWALSNPIA